VTRTGNVFLGAADISILDNGTETAPGDTEIDCKIKLVAKESKTTPLPTVNCLVASALGRTYTDTEEYPGLTLPVLVVLVIDNVFTVRPIGPGSTFTA